MAGRTYILEGHTPVLEKNALTWGRWFQGADCHVGDTKKGDIRVSTVFLGLDHGYGEGRPVLFETLVFGGEYDEEMERYFTWEEAEAGHKRMCEKVFGKEVI